MRHQTLEEVYTGEAARAYRRGCRECADCRLRQVCGVWAVACGRDLNPFREKDPACYLPLRDAQEGLTGPGY